MSRMKKRADEGQLTPGKAGSSASRTDFLIKWETDLVKKIITVFMMELKNHSAQDHPSK